MAGFTRGDVLGIFNMREVLLDVFVEMLRQLLSNKLPISMRSHVLALLLLFYRDYKQGMVQDSVDWQYAQILLKQHTEWTYGLIVYQEQVLGIIRDLGNFALATLIVFGMLFNINLNSFQ